MFYVGFASHEYPCQETESVTEDGRLNTARALTTEDMDASPTPTLVPEVTVYDRANASSFKSTESQTASDILRNLNETVALLNQTTRVYSDG